MRRTMQRGRNKRSVPKVHDPANRDHKSQYVDLENFTRKYCF